jgi:hypothetical protein
VQDGGGGADGAVLIEHPQHCRRRKSIVKDLLTESIKKF